MTSPGEGRREAKLKRLLLAPHRKWVRRESDLFLSSKRHFCFRVVSGGGEGRALRSVIESDPISLRFVPLESSLSSKILGSKRKGCLITNIRVALVFINPCEVTQSTNLEAVLLMVV